MTESHFTIRREAPAHERPHSKSDAQASDRVAVEVWRRLSQSPYHELRQVSFGTNDGVLVLRGSVSSYYLKQLAQEIVRQVDGVETIANQLEVLGEPV